MADYRRPISTGKELPQSVTSTPRVRLSCELCRQRKVKCDKLNPCTNCQRFGATCVPVERARLPRGRSGRATGKNASGQDTGLRERVGRLEELLRGLTEHDVGTIAAQVGSSSSGSSDQAPANKKADKSEPGTENSLWANILKEIHDIRGTKSYGSTNEDRTSNSDAMKFRELLATPRGLGSSMATKEPILTRQAERNLVQVFLKKVDPAFKILHAPSLQAFLLDGKPYLDYEPGHMAPAALSSAIYFAAACSATEDESNDLLGCNKGWLVARYQQESEAALAKADFMTSNDVTILQAFVLFLLASRSQDSSRRVWTMLSMALRIAQALLLHLPELPFPVRPFERELRRRLWTYIGLLDIQCSLERASEPMMQAKWVDSNPPSNVNDCDIFFGMDGPVQESEGFTDMTFAMMTLKAQNTVRLLNFSDFIDKTVSCVNKRQQLVLEFQETASKLLQNSQPDKIPFHWYTRQVAEIISASLQLIVLRPLQRNAKFIPPRVRGDRLLQIAVDVLKKSKTIRNDPRGQRWRWCEFMFVPWHSLAVAIAELCVCEDHSLMESFWGPVRDAYENLGDLIADSRRGMIWKPMEKIMAQAEAKRNELLAASNVVSYPTHFLGTAAPLQVPVCSQPSMQTSVTLTGDIIPNTGAYTEAVPIVTLPETVELGPWPSVWDAVDFGCPVATNEMSWLNYENFIEDVYGTMDYTLLSH
ncbi:hypothetical protein BDV24DRAFT_175711 [Aspergillus arachidicola]|uniref:Zn(2)-C6 fungal-type domain-containing protein n=1 Tax=Aspergillus arachidicola TaxID=656916 RepID=A0A5N6Y6G9_9EURO|nr:hypothetical protein BDV24DRAFT_175711 [Aspergillus arachidicola]